MFLNHSIKPMTHGISSRSTGACWISYISESSLVKSLRNFFGSSALQPLCSSSNLEAAHLSWKRCFSKEAVEVVKGYRIGKNAGKHSLLQLFQHFLGNVFLATHLKSMCKSIWIMKPKSLRGENKTYFKPPT